MDQFDLNWPKMDACFLTDGVRCRIVWRPAAGSGPAGSIDNNELCKKRLAESLPLSPDLLGDLRSRGYPDLAAEIQTLAGDAGQVEADHVDGGRDDAGRMNRVAAWIDGLPGEADWESAATRRGRNWVTIGTEDEEVLELRPPPARGRAEWVLKRSFPGSDRKAEFVVAPHLKGIFSYLADRDGGCQPALVEAALSACADIDHVEVASGRETWA